MLKSLDHAVIAVRDLDIAAATYARLLGRRPSWRGQQPQLGTVNVLFRVDNAYLELLAPAGRGPLAARLEQYLVHDGEGLVALAFGTDDAAACAVELRERGLSVADPADGEGREMSTGAMRTWRSILLPEAQTRGVPLFVIEDRSPPETLPMAEAVAEAGSVVTGVDHVVIMTVDPDASCALYRDRLGLRLALDRRLPERGLRLLFFRVGGVTVECAARIDGPAVPDARDRLWGISYRVADIAAARARVAAAGFDVSDVRPGQRPGTRVCTVRRETHGVSTLFIGPDQRSTAQRRPARSIDVP